MISFGKFICIMYGFIAILLVNAIGLVVTVSPVALGIILGTFISPHMMWLVLLAFISVPFGLSICYFGSNKCAEYMDGVLDK